MGFVLVASGLLMIVTGAKGTYAQFGSQVASDFTGPGNFTYWVVALGAVGSVGYIEALRGFSRMFMALILIAMVLSNKGFFAKLTDALKTGPIAPQAPAAASGSGNAGVDPVTGADMGTTLSGAGLTGKSTSTGANTTSTFSWSNISDWVTKSLPAIFSVAP